MTEKELWNYLLSKINNEYGVAVVMGHQYAESGLSSSNLQNSCNSKFGLTDAEYTVKVDSSENGSYTDGKNNARNFSTDSAGYGLCQWTYKTRKKALLEYAKKMGVSISDTAMQTDFMVRELKSGYKTVWNALTDATEIKAASDVFLTKYEKPANQSDAVKSKRAQYAQTYYDKYAKGGTSMATFKLGNKITTGAQLAQAAVQVAQDYKTLYVMGCFGAPMTAANKRRYKANHSYNKKAERTAFIDAASEDTFGFDCVNLIKGLLWGWDGNKSATYGGASYNSNGVPDISADQMITKCSDVSTSFSKLSVGEALWMSGHIGIYIGDGLSVECTPSFANKVQITAVTNIGAKAGYNGRKWTKHGKLPYVSYSDSASAVSVKQTAAKTSATSVKVETAQKKDKSLSATYKTSAALNMRAGAGMDKTVIAVIPKGASVRCYGYYSVVGSAKWLYVQYTSGGTVLTGFCSQKYLTR